jgi:hypothetical protein
MVARMRKAQLALAVVVIAATRMIACGSTVSASKYDQTCQTAADCVAVGVGDPCSTACEEFPDVDAISRKALETYNYDAFSAQYSCSHCGSISNCPGNAALTKSAYCVQGTCTICDQSDPCSCAPHDPSCTDGGLVEGGTDGETDAAGEAAPPADAPADVPAQQDGSEKDGPQADGPQQDAPAGDSPSGD